LPVTHSPAASSFAFLAWFERFARWRRKVFDSLTANAYGIYLIHYAFVSWLHLALAKSQLAAIAQGSLAFLGAVLSGRERLPGCAAFHRSPG
jgi:hypothetical protein